MIQGAAAAKTQFLCVYFQFWFDFVLKNGKTAPTSRDFLLERGDTFWIQLRAFLPVGSDVLLSLGGLVRANWARKMSG